jgi:adenylosuccinate lyase
MSTSTKTIGSSDLIARLAKDSSVHFSSISPLEYRYKEKRLLPFLSEEAFIWYKAMVETGIVRAFADRGIVPQNSAREIERSAALVNAKEVYEEEDKTNHDIVALVNKIKERMSEDSKSSVHKAATSFDTIDTANTLRYRDAFYEVILPDSAKYLRAMIRVAKDNYDTLQIGRSHLQYGEPITFGFSQALFVDRFGGRMLKMKEAADSLVGKFSGAMGAYNAQSLFVPDPITFEKEVLRQVGAVPADISSQIVQPEFVGDLVHFCIGAHGVLANWADDMRNLMRPEIAEIWLPRGKDVSLSSTMAHKRNPVGFENIKSLWKENMPKMITMYLDQISEGARDLTNSASQRFTPEIFDIFDYAVTRAIRVAENLKAEPENMLRNLSMSKNVITAEPLQLLIASQGSPTAHGDINKLSDRALKENRSVVSLALEDPELSRYMSQLRKDQIDTLSNPEKYIGEAKKVALAIAEKWEKRLAELAF